jgi:hypothetical protein
MDKRDSQFRQEDDKYCCRNNCIMAYHCRKAGCCDLALDGDGIVVSKVRNHFKLSSTWHEIMGLMIVQLHIRLHYSANIASFCDITFIRLNYWRTMIGDQD